MIERTKKMFVVIGKDEELAGMGTKEEAESVAQFFKNSFGCDCAIEEQEKTIYEIEEGDKVYWVKDGIPIKSRIDVVTKITTNSRGDKVYLTEEVNGNRKGMAYEDHIYLAAIVDSIPFFDEYQET